MKNIHILPTDKTSRLFLNKNNNTFFLNEQFDESSPKIIAHNIYITNDEEIKEGEYGIDIRDNRVFKCERTLSNHYESGVLQFQKSYCRKIILTTDQDLIEYGVQAIDDEFLEWFVKNPSCEEVEVIYEPKNFLDTKQGWEYKIIIPKEEPKERLEKYSERFDNDKSAIGNPDTWGRRIVEEPKQETLEEATERILLGEDLDLSDYDKRHILKAMLSIAKWQQEQDKNKYDEEDMKDYALKCVTTYLFNGDFISDNLRIPIVENNNKQFEKFKNK
jgi:hypothetical protein